MKPVLTALILTGMIFILSAGCISGSDSPSSEDGRYVIAVSILPQKEFVTAVGGDHVNVITMIPPGASPATYEPTTEQMLKLASADGYIKVGSPLPFEKTYLSHLITANSGMVIVNSGEGITLTGNDPHIWNSPKNAIIMVRNIADGLAEIDPGNATEYYSNRDAYISRLHELDADITKILSENNTKRFMIFHPAWTYFAQDYGLEQIPIEIGGKEPNAKQLAALVDRAKAENITVIFAAPQMDTSGAKAISDQINGRTETLDPLAPDYIDNLRTVATGIAMEH